MSITIHEYLNLSVVSCHFVTVAVAGLFGGGGERRSPGVLDVFPAAPAIVNPNTSTQSSERGEERFT